MSSQAVASKANLWNDTESNITGHYFCYERPFAFPRSNNAVTAFICGRDAMEAIAKAIKNAKHFIFLVDWQMAFDVELTQRGDPNHPGRLSELLAEAMRERGVHVRVMLYDSVDSSPASTFDDMVAAQLETLNKKGYPGTIRVARHGSTSTSVKSYGYSHHQKMVLIDGEHGFLGGIDMSYGRWETPEFDVVVDPSKSVINEMYNPCVVPARDLTSKESILLLDDCGQKDGPKRVGFAKPYVHGFWTKGMLLSASGQRDGGKVLEEGYQPRMPWQDVHMHLSGPSCLDLYKNFVRRWNSYFIPLGTEAYEGKLMVRTNSSAMTNATMKKLGAIDCMKAVVGSKPGNTQVQIVRSVSNGHLQRESLVTEDLDLENDPALKKIWQECIDTWESKHQDNILQAMLNSIEAAQAYIYIETQFVISRYGRSKDGSNSASKIDNTVISALAAAVERNILKKTSFHIYMVIPVHPEGLASDASTYKQQYNAMEGIKHGSESLIVRIQAALKRAGRNEQEWTQYLTVLNLRNWGITVQYFRDPKTHLPDYRYEIGRYVVTEQIYVHSKIMIVDDAVAIIGSANLNDRSLTGDGDTEIAAVIVDGETEFKDLGNGIQIPTRKFAREFRKSLWEKHMGLLVAKDAHSPEEEEKAYHRGDRYKPEGAAGNKNPPPPHPPRKKTKTVYDWMDKPAHKDAYGAIQSIAQANTKAYEEVFDHIPSNRLRHFDDGMRLYPNYEAERLRMVAKQEQEDNAAYRRMANTVGVTPQELSELQQTQQKKRDVLKPESSAGLSGPPPVLNPVYMCAPESFQASTLRETDPAKRYFTYGGRVHDVKKAHRFLSNMRGFWVSAPLDWGVAVAVADPFTEYTIPLTRNENDPNEPETRES